MELVAQVHVADVAVVMVMDVVVAVDVVVDAVDAVVDVEVDDRDGSSVNRVSMNCIYLLYGCVTFALGL